MRSGTSVLRLLTHRLVTNMKKTFCFLLLTTLVACSSNERRTRYSDKNLRIGLWPSTIDEKTYAAVQTALVKLDMFFVVSRGAGLKAVQREQEALHRNQVDRYQDDEKFAQFGKLYGLGAVVVAKDDCFRDRSFFTGRMVYVCNQYLNLVDANTGQVVVAVDHKAYSEHLNAKPGWNEIAKKLADVYPKYFSRKAITERLELYKKESREHSIRQKHKVIEQKNSRSN